MISCVFLFVMDGQPPGPGEPPIDLHQFTVDQLCVLLWHILHILHRYQNNPDPWEGSGVNPVGYSSPAGVGFSSPAGLFAGPPATSWSNTSWVPAGPGSSSSAFPASPPAAAATPSTQPPTCAYNCQICDQPCCMNKGGHHNHRCQLHHD